MSDPLAPGARALRSTSWGEPPAAARKLAGHIEAELHKRFGTWESTLTPVEPVYIPAVDESRADGTLRAQLAQHSEVLTQPGVRAAYSLGKSYPDLIVARSDRLTHAFDLVVRPHDAENALAHIVAVAAEAGARLVPVGGGTSVVGGIEPIARGDQITVAVDMTGLSGIVDIDHVSHLARIRAGTRGPALEQELAAHGYTLGHVPQSFELSTLGGWIAARSAGQQSLGFGRIDDLIAGARVHTRDGLLSLDPLPAHGAGPDLLDVIAGSEGRLGPIADATMRVVPRPQRMRMTSYLFADFAQACAAARTMVQAGVRPAMLRISDPEETGFQVASSLPDSALLRRSLALVARGARRYCGCLAICIIVGDSEEVARTQRRVTTILGRGGGVSVGAVPAKAWYRSRFIQPYVRDLLIDRGVMVDTLETSATWAQIPGLHRDMRSALMASLGAQTLVGCHLSHLYPDGASLYFTILGAGSARADLAGWRAAKQAAHNVIHAHHAAASHQHGVGSMHKELHGDGVGVQAVELTNRMFAENPLDVSGSWNAYTLGATTSKSSGAR